MRTLEGVSVGVMVLVSAYSAPMVVIGIDLGTACLALLTLVPLYRMLRAEQRSEQIKTTQNPIYMKQDAPLRVGPLRGPQFPSFRFVR